MSIRLFILLPLLASSISIHAQQVDTARITQQLRNMNDIMYSNQDSALLIIEEIEQLCEDDSLAYFHSWANFNRAVIYGIRGNYTQAIEFNLYALEKARMAEDSMLIMSVYNNLGDNNMNIGNYEEAYNLFNQSLEIAQKREDILIEGIISLNMGIILKNLKRYDESVDKLYESLDFSVKAQDVEGPAYVYNEIGHVYFLQQDYDSALYFLNKAYQEMDTLTVFDLMADNLKRAAFVYLHTNRYAEAEEHLEEAKTLVERIQNLPFLSGINNGLALLELKRKNYNKAIEILTLNIDLTDSIREQKENLEAYQLLSQAYESLGNPSQAYTHYKKFSVLRDSLNDKLYSTRIYNLQKQYELQSKDFEISLLNAREEQRLLELDKQKSLQNILVVLLALMFFLLLTVYRSGLRRRRINNLLRKHKEEAETKNSELDELNKVKDKFISILAHDLRSPIRTLSGLLNLLENERLTPEESKQLIADIRKRTQQTSSLLDNLLKWTLLQMNKMTVKKEEFEVKQLVQQNIELVKGSKGKEIDWQVHMDEAIVFADKNMIDLVIRNLLSNSVKFTDHGSITVTMTENMDHVVLHIKDTGKGMTEEELASIFDRNKLVSTMGTDNEKGTGLGLKLSQEFVEKNGGEIWVQSERKVGTTFSFSIPKNK